MGEYKCFLVTVANGIDWLDCAIKIPSEQAATNPAAHMVWIEQYLPMHVLSGKKVVKIVEIFEVCIFEK